MLVVWYRSGEVFAHPSITPEAFEANLRQRYNESGVECLTHQFPLPGRGEHAGEPWPAEFAELLDEFPGLDQLVDDIGRLWAGALYHTITASSSLQQEMTERLTRGLDRPPATAHEWDVLWELSGYFTASESIRNAQNPNDNLLLPVTRREWEGLRGSFNFQDEHSYDRKPHELVTRDLLRVIEHRMRLADGTEPDELSQIMARDDAYNGRMRAVVGWAPRMRGLLEEA
ncbi:hypothetical protein REH65_31420 [Saccharopolyspora sp. ID03-671]|uniref:hypothetical protein n=1 Tax=Saccharopolyspora sp. ID03-671 TaxID=3073066 RepID=UPI003244C5A8